MTAIIERWPEDDDELHEFVACVWDIDIPKKPVCPNHCAPFDAFADAYFARSPVSVWKASRGLGGKSTLMGILAITESVTLNAQITVLGGSAAQSQRVHEVTKEAWYAPLAPRQMLHRDPTTFHTSLINGGWITALMASQTSVRGPHPQRLRLDEIDEMDLPILEAAQGQPMEKVINGKLVQSQTVMSSTHQYPDKTMTEILKRARKQGWPVFEWCYKDNLEPNGWLTQRQVDRKKSEVSEAMWAIEFDLQEPSFEGRAIDPAKVEWCFSASLGTFNGDNNEVCKIEDFDPLARGRYITAVDWAKEQDWTIISTWRCDVVPWICVCWRRLGRMPWPVMVGYLNDRLDEYGGYYVHDATGLGNVISDLIDYDTRNGRDVVMQGASRTAMFNEYIKAIETHEMQYPRIDYAYNEHKYVTLDDLYGRGHPPDSVVSGALAWSMRDVVRAPHNVAPVVIKRVSPWRR